MKERFEKGFALKTSIIAEKEQCEGRILNRFIRWTPEKLEYEADQPGEAVEGGGGGGG